MEAKRESKRRITKIVAIEDVQEIARAKENNMTKVKEMSKDWKVWKNGVNIRKLPTSLQCLIRREGVQRRKILIYLYLRIYCK